MINPPKIAVVGSINVDLVGCGACIPKPGETLHGKTFAQTYGGKGANQAVAAAKAGADVEMFGAVGDDDFGHGALAALQGYGVNTGHCRVIPNQTTGVALIMIGTDAENSIMIVAGANGDVSGADLESVDWASYDAVVLQLEIPMPTVEAVIRNASRHTKVILTPAPACRLPDELLKQVDVLVPNEHELMLAADCADFEAAVAKVAGLVRAGVAVTLGDKGVRWVSSAEDFTIPAFECDPIDTVGAGDCFTGFFATAWLSGATIRDTLTRANAAACLQIQRNGAQTAMPSAV
jgi:ribokinase